MSFKTRSFSILTLIVATVAFASIGFAQDKPTTETVKPGKVERPRRDGQGKREFGGKGGFDRKREFGGRQRGQGRMFGGLMRGIDLTDAQKAQIRSIREANKPNRENMEAIRAIIQAKRAGTITADQEAQLKAFRDQARAKANSVHEQIAAVFTAEQNAQIAQRKVEMKQRMEQMKLRMQERRKDREVRKQKPAVTTTEKPKVN